MYVKPAIDEFNELRERSTGRIAIRLVEVAQSLIRSSLRARSVYVESDYAPQRLQDLVYREILDAMQLADLYGRRRLILEADAARGSKGDTAAAKRVAIENSSSMGHAVFCWLETTNAYQFAKRAGLPEGVKAGLGREGPPFKEMIADLLKRSPKLASTADEVAAHYRSAHAFAAVGNPTIEVAQAVQRKIADLQKRGATLATAEKELIETTILKEITPWARWYAETVFRTNVSTAYSAGRWKQVSDPVVRQVIGAFRYTAVSDGDTRPNHAAADGLIAGVDDPIWNQFSPPLGYNCRCMLELVDVFDLSSMGLLTRNNHVTRYEPPGFSEAGPDSARFGGGRPDRRIYGF